MSQHPNPYYEPPSKNRRQQRRSGQQNQQRRYQAQPLQLPEKVYKRRIRCWQCHDQVEEAPTLFCSKCQARLLWYNLHLEPGEKPVSYQYPEPEVEKPSLAIIAYMRPGGVQGQYKLGALFELPYGYSPWLTGVFEDDTFDRRVIVPCYTDELGAYKGVYRKREREKLTDFLMNGLLPGNILIFELHVNEVIFKQVDIFRVTEQGVVRVGMEEKKRMRLHRERGDIWVPPSEQSPDLMYIPCVDLDNVEESLWLEAVHQRNAKPELAHVYAEEIRQLLLRPTPAYFNMRETFNRMHQTESRDPQGWINSHLLIAERTRPPEEPELPLNDPPLIDTKTGYIFGELTNKTTALVVYMHETFKGHTVRLSCDKQREALATEGIEGYNFSSIEAEVQVFSSGEQTCYAVIFDSIPLPLERYSKKARSTGFEVRVGNYSLSIIGYADKSHPVYHKEWEPSKISVYLQPGQVKTYDWTWLIYKGNL